MLVGIMSDSHDNLPMIRRAVTVLTDARVECLIHAGDFIAPFALKEVLKFDGPIHAVLGNNDGEVAGLTGLLGDLSRGPRRIELGGKTFVIVHDETRLTVADLASVDVVVVGHTHEVHLRDGTPLVINPGECSGWLKGACTVATIDTETLSTEIINLGEKP